MYHMRTTTPVKFPIFMQVVWNMQGFLSRPSRISPYSGTNPRRHNTLQAPTYQERQITSTSKNPWIVSLHRRSQDHPYKTTHHPSSKVTLSWLFTFPRNKPKKGALVGTHYWQVTLWVSWLSRMQNLQNHSDLVFGSLDIFHQNRSKALKIITETPGNTLYAGEIHILC